jgi:hypothetical protein
MWLVFRLLYPPPPPFRQCRKEQDTLLYMTTSTLYLLMVRGSKRNGTVQTKLQCPPRWSARRLLLVAAVKNNTGSAQGWLAYGVVSPMAGPWNH